MSDKGRRMQRRASGLAALGDKTAATAGSLSGRIGVAGVGGGAAVCASANDATHVEIARTAKPNFDTARIINPNTVPPQLGVVACTVGDNATFAALSRAHSSSH